MLYRARNYAYKRAGNIKNYAYKKAGNVGKYSLNKALNYYGITGNNKRNMINA